MIFQQWKQLMGLEELPKEQSRRVVGLNEFFYDAERGMWVGSVQILPAYPPGVNTLYTISNGKLRRKHYVGQKVAIVPKRGAPAIWVGPNGEILKEVTSYYGTLSAQENRLYFLHGGYHEARAEIIAMREEALQAITPSDALAEGVADIPAYQVLWESINGRRSTTKWAANPQVVVYTFRYPL